MSLIKLLGSSFDPLGRLFIRKYLPSTGTWYAVAGGDNKYVAIRGQLENTNLGAFSSDGYNWQNITLGPSLPKYDITYGNGRFVAPGFNSNSGVTSTDGINWTNINLGGSTAWTSIAYGAGRFVAISYQSTIVSISNNGVTGWTTAAYLPSSRNWWKVRFINNTFIALSLSNIYATSTNGTAWVQRSFPTTGTEQWRTPIGGNGVFLVVGLNNGGSSNVILRSTDAINWTQVTIPTPSGVVNSWTTGVFTGKIFVLISYGGNLAISQDGLNWQYISSSSALLRQDSDSFNSTNFQNAIYDNNKIIMVGFGANNIYTSPPR